MNRKTFLATITALFTKKAGMPIHYTKSGYYAGWKQGRIKGYDLHIISDHSERRRTRLG